LDNPPLAKRAFFKLSPIEEGDWDMHPEVGYFGDQGGGDRWRSLRNVSCVEDY